MRDLVSPIPQADRINKRQICFVMDHRYIEVHSVVQRYLDRTLGPGDRAAFESHLVDCQECTDRVLLAEMFHAREPVQPIAEQPLRSRFVAQFKPWQLVLLFAVTTFLLLAIPTAYFLWQLQIVQHAK